METMDRAAGLPQLSGIPVVTEGGLETDLIYHHDVDLPDFAAFVLVDDDRGRDLLRRYYGEYVDIARVQPSSPGQGRNSRGRTRPEADGGGGSSLPDRLVIWEACRPLRRERGRGPEKRCVELESWFGHAVGPRPMAPSP
jgi:hypothetical protein